MQDVNWIALIIFIAVFGFITWLGFAAANWRRGDLDLLHEWGLGGRRFGTIVTLTGGQIVESIMSQSSVATKTLDLAYYNEATAFFH